MAKAKQIRIKFKGVVDIEGFNGGAFSKRMTRSHTEREYLSRGMELVKIIP